MAIAESVIGSSAETVSVWPARAAIGTVRVYFLMLATFGLAALVLGVENRLTPDLFPVAPPVDLMPPLGEGAWFQAYVLHQQDPVFAACGGSENLGQFKILYWWEWLRRGSMLLLTSTFMFGFFIAALLPDYRFALKRLVGLGLIGLGYLAAVSFFSRALAQVADLARYDTGQYRHALDMTFASVALAVVMASAVVPPAAVPSRCRMSHIAWLLGGSIVLDICSGALFASRDALSVWGSFPWYETGLLPPFDQLTAYAPMWLNFTFNQYMIQLVHRVLSIGLAMGLVAYAIWAIRGSPRARRGAVVLLVLIAAEMAAGVAALLLGGSRPTSAFMAASFVHEIGAIALLAAAFAILPSRRPAGRVTRRVRRGVRSGVALAGPAP